MFEFYSNKVIHRRFCSLICLLIILVIQDRGLHSYPMPQMRICIQSIDSSRLPSQCVYCKSRIFPLTVRMCTRNQPYLPASMSLNEAACLVATCRKQLPRYPPEPYSGISPSSNSMIGGNVRPGNNNIQDDLATTYHSNPNQPANDGGMMSGNLNHNNNNNLNTDDNLYEETESLIAEPTTSTKIRKPAKFFLGKPQKIQSSMRPVIFGR